MWIERAFTTFIDLVILFVIIGGPIMLLGLISTGIHNIYKIYRKRVERRRKYYVNTNRYGK